METTISATIKNELYVTEIHSENNTILSDEPLSNGGQDKGFNPFELLASSLASCSCITLKMYANRKQWNIDQIQVAVTITSDLNQTNFERNISFVGEIDDEQKKRLLVIANSCPVHKILSNSIQVQTKIV